MGFEPVGEGQENIQAQDIIGSDRRCNRGNVYGNPEDHPANHVFGITFGANLGNPTGIGLTERYTGAEAQVPSGSLRRLIVLI